MSASRTSRIGMFVSFELSADGKAMKYYDTVPFAVTLTPQSIALAARTLTTEEGHS